jgi:hypothetical protein
MKTCPGCGNPIAKERNEALTEPSIQCPKCSAPISSISPNKSQLSKEQIQADSSIPPQNPKPTSLPTHNRQSAISTDQLHTDTPSTKTHVDPSQNGERESEMETEAETQKPNMNNEDPLPTPEERAEARRLSLSRQGFVVEEDAHGLRLSGVASRPGGLSSELSPYDVIRLAAELEGGLLPVEQRKRCPKCDAVVNPGDKQCQWCSESL